MLHGSLGLNDYESVDHLALSGRDCLLIIGMHRSGTSALTRVVSLLGFDLPRTLLGGNDSNPTGHWESDPLIKVNDRLLALCGENWRVWRPIAPGLLETPSAHAVAALAARIVREEFGSSRRFVFKDPRVSVLLPFWLRLFDEQRITPHLLFTVRHPLEVARSLCRRNAMAPSVGQLIWLRHVLSSEQATRGRRRHFTSYDRLLDNWREEVGRIGDGLGLGLKDHEQERDDEVQAFLAPSLRHHRVDDSTSPSDELLEWCREAYAIFAAWAEAGEQAADHVRLDELRAAFDRSADLLAPVIESAVTIEALEGRQRGTEQELERLTEINRESEGALVRASEERDLAYERAAQADEGRLVALAELEQERGHRAALTAQLAAGEAALAESLQHFATQAERIAKLEVVAAQTEALRVQVAELAERARCAEQALADAERTTTEVRRIACALADPVPGAFGLFERRWWTKREEQLAASGLFDAAAYREREADVRRDGWRPLLHYLRHGIDEGRDPV